MTRESMEYPEDAVAACSRAIGNEMIVRDGRNAFRGEVVECVLDGAESVGQRLLVVFRIWLRCGRPTIRGPFRVTAVPVGKPADRAGMTRALDPVVRRRDNAAHREALARQEKELEERTMTPERRRELRRWADQPGPWSVVHLPMVRCESPSCPTNARKI